MSIINSLLGALDTTSLVIFLLVFLFGYYWMTAPKNLPPGPTGLPVLGNLLTMRNVAARGEILSQMMKWRETYGDVFRVKMGNRNLIVINNFKMLQNAFVKNGDIFSARPDNLYILSRINEAIGSVTFGCLDGLFLQFNTENRMELQVWDKKWANLFTAGGVITASGPPWKELRRVTLMTLRDFGVGKKSLEQRVQDEARAIVEVMEKGEGRRLAPLKPILSKFASNVICSITLGDRFEYDDPIFNELLKLVNDFTSQPLLFTPVNFVPAMRFTPAGRRMVEHTVGSFKTIDNFLSKVLKDHEETYDASEIRDFVDLYIKTRSESENAHFYNARNMRRVIIDLFAAGTDTAATTVSWAILYFAAYPKVQVRCQQEVDKVLGDRLATLEDRKSMPYIEAFLTEVLRIATIAPFAVPHMATRDAEIGGYSIPAGSVVVANIRAIHYEPNNWPQPSVFKPERFLDKDGNFCPPKENFMPFSVGPRSCLGEVLARMEVFILLTTLVRSFTFATENGHEPDLEGRTGVVHSPKDQPVVAKLR